MEKQIQDIIFNQDNITWQSLLMDLVKQEGMDPWDIDVSELANSYIKTVKKLKQANLGISGKVVLASALLLKVKSKRLIGDDMDNLDNLFKKSQDDPMLIGEFDDVDLLNPMLDQALGQFFDEPRLTPRTPQPRKRKVSVFDLVEALEKAMNLRRRRVTRDLPGLRHKLEVPEALDVGDIIVSVYRDIKEFYKKTGKRELKFSDLIKGDDKSTKVFTFIPLLHLHNERRLDLDQKEYLGEID